MRAVLHTLVIFVAVLAVPTAVGAQDSCSAVLIPTQQISFSSADQELAFAATIDNENEFQKAKSAGAGGRYGLFSGSANYSEFESRRSRLFSQTGFRMSSSEAERFATTFLPPQLAEAWLSCMAAQDGIIILPRDIADDAVTVRYRWRPNGREPIVNSVSISGSTLTESELRSRLQTSYSGPFEDTIIVPRIPEAPLRLALTIGGDTDSIFLPPPVDYQDVSVALGPFEGNLANAECVSRNNPGTMKIEGSTITFSTPRESAGATAVFTCTWAIEGARATEATFYFDSFTWRASGNEPTGGGGSHRFIIRDERGRALRQEDWSLSTGDAPRRNVRGQSGGYPAVYSRPNALIVVDFLLRDSWANRAITWSIQNPRVSVSAESIVPLR